MKTGFIIVNCNSWNMTEKLAQKVASFVHIDAVVVVDNASTDDSFWRLKQLNHKKIHVFQTSENGDVPGEIITVCTSAGTWGWKLYLWQIQIQTWKKPTFRKYWIILRLTVIRCYPEWNMIFTETCVSRPLWKRKEYWDDVGDCFFLWRTFSRKNFGTALDKNTEVQPAEMVKGSFFAVRLEDFLDAGGFDEQIFYTVRNGFCQRKWRTPAGKWEL